MKARLNVTIKKALLMKVKRYAKKRKVSVSQLVEDQLATMLEPKSQENLLEVLARLPKPKKVPKGDLVKAYYEANRKKYGF